MPWQPSVQLCVWFETEIKQTADGGTPANGSQLPTSHRHRVDRGLSPCRHQGQIQEWQDHNLGTAIAVLVRHDRGESQCDKYTKRRYWQREPQPWPSYAVRILNISLGSRRCWHFSSHLWECIEPALRIGTENSELVGVGLSCLPRSFAVQTFTCVILHCLRLFLQQFVWPGFVDILSFFGVRAVTWKRPVVDLIFNTKEVCRKFSSSGSQLFDYDLFCRLLFLNKCAWYHTKCCDGEPNGTERTMWDFHGWPQPEKTRNKVRVFFLWVLKLLWISRASVKLYILILLRLFVTLHRPLSFIILSCCIYHSAVFIIILIIWIVLTPPPPQTELQCFNQQPTLSTCCFSLTCTVYSTKSVCFDTSAIKSD